MFKSRRDIKGSKVGALRHAEIVFSSSKREIKTIYSIVSIGAFSWLASLHSHYLGV